MTIAKTGSSASYAGNGSTVAFSFPFRFFDDTDLKVYIVASDGSSTLKTITTDYTVSNTQTENGGTVTMVVAPASGETLLIEREIPATQSVDYQNNDAFPAETHESALDRLTLLVQEQSRSDNRHLTFPTGDTNDPTLPTTANRASRLLGFDAQGAIQTYVPETTVLPDAVITSVEEFGAVGDGATDDTTSIQNAINFVRDAGGGMLSFAAKTYIVTGLTIYSQVIFIGRGSATVLKLKDGANVDMITTEDYATLVGTSASRVSEGVPYKWGIRDMNLDGNRANNTSGVGIRAYSRAYDLINVEIFDFAEHGVDSEKNESTTESGINDQVEGVWNKVRIRNCGGNGVYYRGPHDVSMQDVVCARNSRDGFNFSLRKYITISGLTGTISVGETITGGTSGASGEVTYVSGTKVGVDTAGTFQVAETVTTAGGSATVASLDSSTSASHHGLYMHAYTNDRVGIRLLGTALRCPAVETSNNGREGLVLGGYNNDVRGHVYSNGRLHYVTVSGLSGTFTRGESTSDQSANTLLANNTNPHYDTNVITFIAQEGVQFNPGDTITGASSGATATVVSVDTGATHQVDIPSSVGRSNIDLIIRDSVAYKEMSGVQYDAVYTDAKFVISGDGAGQTGVNILPGSKGGNLDVTVNGFSGVGGIGVRTNAASRLNLNAFAENCAMLWSNTTGSYNQIKFTGRAESGQVGFNGTRPADTEKWEVQIDQNGTALSSEFKGVTADFFTNGLGEVTQTIPHGLIVAPEQKDVSLSMFSNPTSPITTWEGDLHITGVDATNISVRLTTRTIQTPVQAIRGLVQARI